MARRGLIREIFKHFTASFKPRQNGVYMGDDYFGNKYYEIPADPSRGKRNPKRFYVSPVDMRYDQDNMPAEWDAWLRYRRDTPPSEGELKGNLTIATMKKENAEKIEGSRPAGKQTHSDMSSFPIYEDFEVTPGEKPREKGD
ncbi:NADH dehydrogenase [ubiquinone] 1 alpha subcomplex assembly factor 2 [Palaemon carinicauda]|uniref:NADH dehydrogenase [ubiquinone] 1 alpha subcomplex assembly factor 2 n=1 Tax=Palaemon carinicauda TaxID=392227 RepID=UPI0035B5BD61